MNLPDFWDGDRLSLVLALAIGLSGCNAPSQEPIAYRADDGTYLHAPTTAGRFYYSTSPEDTEAERAQSDLGGQLHDCSDADLACVALEEIILAVPKSDSKTSWSIRGSDFRKVTTRPDGTMEVSISVAGETYARFEYLPSRGVTNLHLGIYGSEDFRNFQLISGKGLLAGAD